MEENMTDFQFRTILEMILKILEGSKDLEEAKASISKLLEDEKKV